MLASMFIFCLLFSQTENHLSHREGSKNNKLLNKDKFIIASLICGT